MKKYKYYPAIFITLFLLIACTPVKPNISSTKKSVTKKLLPDALKNEFTQFNKKVVISTGGPNAITKCMVFDISSFELLDSENPMHQQIIPNYASLFKNGSRHVIASG